MLSDPTQGGLARSVLAYARFRHKLQSKGHVGVLLPDSCLLPVRRCRQHDSSCKRFSKFIMAPADSLQDMMC